MSSQKPDDHDPITQQILQAASELLQQVGDGFTMEQLAAQANVPRATVYRRVRSKIALLERLVQETGVTFSPQRDTRTRILQAARQVFGRTGLVNASIEAIASEADVGVATIYRHFGDKDHLVRAMLEELAVRPVVRDLIEPTTDVAADLLMLTRLLLPMFYEYRDLLRFVFTSNQAERAYIEHLRAGSTSTLAQITTYFATQLAAGRITGHGSAAELALGYLGLLFAFTVLGPTNYAMSLTDPEHTSALITQIFVGGLGGGTHVATNR